MILSGSTALTLLDEILENRIAESENERVNRHLLPRTSV